MQDFWIRFSKAVKYFGLNLIIISLVVFFFSNKSISEITMALNNKDNPTMTVLVAARDVAYCGYRLRCENQMQRENLFQAINTDTIMLVRLKNNKIDILSIPRDTNAFDFNPDKSISSQKINNQYMQGGPLQLKKAVEHLTNEKIDSYVIINEEYVSKIIDDLGGLEVDIPNSGIVWKDMAAGIDLDLKPGKQTLDGKTAAWYLRVRKGVGDDWGRIDHQKQALNQLFSKLKSPAGIKIIPLLISHFNEIESSLDVRIITSVLANIKNLSLNFFTLPTMPIINTFNLEVDREAFSKLWHNNNIYLNENTKIINLVNRQNLNKNTRLYDKYAYFLDYKDYPILIKDGSNEYLGHALKRQLNFLGFNNIEVEFSKTFPSSQIVTKNSLIAAQDLRELLNLPMLQGERFEVPFNGLVIFLGQDSKERFVNLIRYRKKSDLRDYGFSYHEYEALQE